MKKVDILDKNPMGPSSMNWGWTVNIIRIKNFSTGEVAFLSICSSTSEGKDLYVSKEEVRDIISCMSIRKVYYKNFFGKIRSKFVKSDIQQTLEESLRI